MAIFNSYVSLPEGINCCFSGNPNHHSMTMSRSWKMYSNAACKVWLPEPVAMDGMAMEALKYAAPRHQRWNLLTWMIYKMWQRFSDMDSPSDFPVKKVRDHFCAFRARSCLAGLALAIYGRLNVNESMHSFFFKPVQTPRSTYTCTYYHIIYVYIIHVSIYLYIYYYVFAKLLAHIISYQSIYLQVRPGSLGSLTPALRFSSWSMAWSWENMALSMVLPSGNLT